MVTRKSILKSILSFLIAGLGGWLLSLSGVSLAWMIGAMLSMVIASLLQLPVSSASTLMPFIKASIGTMLGTSITMSVLMAVGTWWFPLMTFMSSVIIASLLSYWGLRRWFGHGPKGAVLCSIPGGITEMILMGDQPGVNQSQVAIVHSFRIALSILSIPIIVSLVSDLSISRPTDIEINFAMSIPDWGWFVACVIIGLLANLKKVIPAALIVAPMVLSAFLHITGITHFVVPDVILIFVQVFIGINVGSRFIGITFKTLVNAISSAIWVSGVQISFAMAAALVIVNLMKMDLLSVMLAFSPGGLAEMSLMAIAMGRDVALVTFHHIIRIVCAIAIAPFLLKRFD